MLDWTSEEHVRQLSDLAEKTCRNLINLPVIGEHCDRGLFQWGVSVAVTSIIMDKDLSQGESHDLQIESMDRVGTHIFNGNFRNLHLRPEHLIAFSLPGKTGEPRIAGGCRPMEIVMIIRGQLLQLQSSLSLDLEMIIDLANYMLLASAIAGRSKTLWSSRITKACRWLDKFSVQDLDRHAHARNQIRGGQTLSAAS